MKDDETDMNVGLVCEDSGSMMLFIGEVRHFPAQRRKMHGRKCSDETGRTESGGQIFV